MKRLRIFILLTISGILLLLPKNWVNACGFFVAPGEYRFWLLQPDLTRERDLTPFYFASTYLYRGNEYGGMETYVEKNVKEWFEWVHLDEAKGGSGKIRVSQGDIDSLLNNTVPNLFFEHLD